VRPRKRKPIRAQAHKRLFIELYGCEADSARGRLHPHARRQNFPAQPNSAVLAGNNALGTVGEPPSAPVYYCDCSR
jgi:hypothetical protein